MRTRAGLTVFPRERIGLRAPTGDYSSAGRLFHASVHHGGPVGGRRKTFASAARTWRDWQRYHQQSNGWLDIGYNFGIDARGRLYEGRPVGTLCAAVGGHNTGQISFCFMQDGRYYKLNFMQRRTLRILFEKGIPELGVPPLRKFATNPDSDAGVFGHQEYSGHSSNACPGSLIMTHLRWRRNRYA